MSAKFEIVEVPAEAAEAPEQLGTKYKFWYADSGLLYKEGRPGTGENWSEKIACEIADLLALPHALYQLATWRDRQGVVTPNFVPIRHGGRLVLGNEVLSTSVGGYVKDRMRGQSAHTVRLVMTVLGHPGVLPPHGWAASGHLKEAADVFLGYLMLDAVVGNTDRHHENWGWVHYPGKAIELAPTFDHASCLGRELTDDRRRITLEGKEPRRNFERYTEKTRSALFRASKDRKPLAPIDAFYEAALIRPAAGKEWLDRLDSLNEQTLTQPLRALPDTILSGPACAFADRLICLNRNALLSRRKEIP